MLQNENKGQQYWLATVTLGRSDLVESVLASFGKSYQSMKNYRISGQSIRAHNRSSAMIALLGFQTRQATYCAIYKKGGKKNRTERSLCLRPCILCSALYLNQLFRDRLYFYNRFQTLPTPASKFLSYMVSSVYLWAGNDQSFASWRRNYQRITMQLIYVNDSAWLHNFGPFSALANTSVHVEWMWTATKISKREFEVRRFTIPVA